MIDPLFGKYCYIDTPWIAGKHTIYRIIRSGVRSNSWCEVPVNGRTEKVNHGEHSEEIVFVMLDTLIDEDTKIMRFALKDVEIIEMADHKTEPSDSEKPNNCEVKNYCDDCLYNDVCDNKEFFYACTSKSTISKMEQVDEPQTDTEIAKAIVHKMIDDAVIAEDAYPDLRQKMHDAVDEYEPQTDCAWREPCGK